MSYDINVLCNGNRCKQYLHNGRTFIEAKKGSEYVIELKNNSWEKILAVVSVDGLNVIDGNPAKDTGGGYILNKYTSQKFHGFQYNSEKVAAFTFGAMGATDEHGNKLGYAASKENGSEENVGVIGVRIWDEIPQNKFVPRQNYATRKTGSGGGYNPNPLQWEMAEFEKTYSGGGYNPNPLQWDMAEFEKTYHQHQNMADGIADMADGTGDIYHSPPPSGILRSCNTIGSSNIKPASFDMETQWGKQKNYKVREIEFQRKDLIHEVDIYYTSRESLIEMGVDLGSVKRVSFPKSFNPTEQKYATPPPGWES